MKGTVLILKPRTWLVTYKPLGDEHYLVVAFKRFAHVCFTTLTESPCRRLFIGALL